MHNLFFNIVPNSASPNPTTGAGVINAPQTALTFAGAPTAVTVVMKVIEAINGDWALRSWSSYFYPCSSEC